MHGARSQELIAQHRATDSTTAPTRSPSTSSSALRGAARVLAVGATSVLILFLLGVFAMGLPLALSDLSKGSVGVFLSTNAAGETVLTPVAGAAAEIAGVRQGDVLLAVDGVVLVPWGPGNVTRDAMAGPPGAAIALEVRSIDGTVRQLVFSRDPFALEPYGISAELYARVLTVLSVLFVVGYCIPAAIIFARKSDDWQALLVSVALVAMAVPNSPAFAGELLTPGWLLLAVGFIYNVAVLLVLCLFPSGRLAPRWTRIYLALGLGWIAFKLSPVAVLIGSQAAPWWNTLFYLCDVSVFGAGIVAQVVRYRQVSSTSERLQTKWIVYGMVMAFLAQYAYWITLNVSPALASMQAKGLAFRAIAGTLHQLAMLVMPFTFLRAVLKRHLYNIDLIISGTLIYVPLTAIIAGAFAATATLLQRGFVALTGQKSDLAAVLASVFVVVLITPVRDRLQNAVTKRFKGTPPAIGMLQAFEEQVKTRMAPVQSHHAIRRMLEEAVKAMEAEGGAAYEEGLENPLLVHSMGTWTGQAQLTMPVEVVGKRFGSIALGARRGRREYGAAERVALRRTAETVARAIDEDTHLAGVWTPPAS